MGFGQGVGRHGTSVSSLSKLDTGSVRFLVSYFCVWSGKEVTEFRSKTDGIWENEFWLKRNEVIVQKGTMDQMVFPIEKLIEYLSARMPLLEGDLIFSGTPANSRPVKPGDRVEVEVEGLGRLENNVVEGDFGVDIDFGAQPSESEEVISTALGGDWEFRGIRSPQ